MFLDSAFKALTLKSIISFLAICLLTACSTPTPKIERAPHLFDDQLLREIYDFANTESWDSIMPFATSNEAAYRLAFAKIMGSANYSQARSKLEYQLSDQEAYVQLYAAWAVGQYGDTASIRPLWSAFLTATEPHVRSEILLAIGKCSNRAATLQLLQLNPADLAEELGKLWALYSCELRGHIHESDLADILPFLQSPEAESRLAVAHLLYHNKRLDLRPEAKLIWNMAVNETNSDVRSVLAYILPNEDKDCLQLRARLAGTDPSPAVRAKALSGFPETLNDEGKIVFRSALEDEAPWVAMVAAQRLSDYFDLADSSFYDQLSLRTEVPEIDAALMSVYLNHSISIPKAQSIWHKNVVIADSPIRSAVFLKQLASSPACLDTLTKYVIENSPIGTAAAEALTAQAKKSNMAKSKLLEAAKNSFEHVLAGQSAVFAEALTDTTVYRLADIPITSVKAAIEKFQKPSNLEVRESLLNLLKTWTKVELTYPRPAAKPIDWEMVLQIPSDCRAIFYTSEGSIETVLLVDDAPGSTANFVALVHSKFYDGLGFHRVVPGFVSQGGDPQKDGYGSANYVIRSEFSPLQFGPGVLGYASLGPHTEGCQFFFTHTSAPHLNGRYTIFGALTSGWETLEAIHTASIIDSIRIAMPMR